MSACMFVYRLVFKLLLHDRGVDGDRLRAAQPALNICHPPQEGSLIFPQTPD